MANPEHVELAKKGSEAVAQWRRQNKGMGLDLEWADLSGANLIDANFSGANLMEADLSGANLIDANFSGANLSKATLFWANLAGANFTGADLSGAHLLGANISDLQLSRAKFKAPSVEKRVAPCQITPLAHLMMHQLGLFTIVGRVVEGLRPLLLMVGQDRKLVVEAEEDPEISHWKVLFLTVWCRASSEDAWRCWRDVDEAMSGLRQRLSKADLDKLHRLIAVGVDVGNNSQL